MSPGGVVGITPALPAPGRFARAPVAARQERQPGPPCGLGGPLSFCPFPWGAGRASRFTADAKFLSHRKTQGEVRLMTFACLSIFDRKQLQLANNTWRPMCAFTLCLRLPKEISSQHTSFL